MNAAQVMLDQFISSQEQVNNDNNNKFNLIFNFSIFSFLKILLEMDETKRYHAVIAARLRRSRTRAQSSE